MITAGEEDGDDSSGPEDGGTDKTQAVGQAIQAKGYRIVAKSWKGVIKAEFDYHLLLQRMEGLQDSCHKAIYGLFLCIDTLVDMIVA